MGVFEMCLVKDLNMEASNMYILNCVNVFKSNYITTIGGLETRAYQ